MWLLLTGFSAAFLNRQRQLREGQAYAAELLKDKHV
jgi:hypothetical protein